MAESVKANYQRKPNTERYGFPLLLSGDNDFDAPFFEYPDGTRMNLGGGFQSQMLRQAVANLINKKIRVRAGFQQASVTGGTVVCNHALGIRTVVNEAIEEIVPMPDERHQVWYHAWKKVRYDYKKMSSE